MDIDKKLVQSRLRERRLLLQMTYQDLANKTGLSKSTLQRYETGGIKNLPIDNIYKISEALEIDTAYFTDPEYESKEQTDNSPSSFSRLSREIHRKELSQFIDSAIQILAPTLLRKEYSVLELNRGPFDLEAKKHNELWYFDFMLLAPTPNKPGYRKYRYKDQLMRRFGYLAVYQKSITKYSIVVNEKDAFDQIIEICPKHLNIK